jgi:uncharacterized protein YcgI (DUF1989 family)
MIVLEHRIPAAHGKAFRLDAGDTISVINTFGQQVVDTWAFDAKDINHRLSMELTRRYLLKLRPSVGDVLYTNYRNPILSLIGDTSDGMHDTLITACDKATYDKLGCGDHRSCADNLAEALAELGLSLPFTPGPINLFMNIPISNDMNIEMKACEAPPGATVTLRAEIDCYIAFSCCPMDIVPVNGPDGRLNPVDIRIERSN